MTRGARFERDDILGDWYPTDCVVALLSPAEAAGALAGLRAVGFADGDVRLWTGKETLERVAVRERRGGLKILFRAAQRELSDNDHALNVYEQGARHGLDVIAVYAPRAAEQHRAHQILARRYATRIKFYGHLYVTDLSA